MAGDPVANRPANSGNGGRCSIPSAALRLLDPAEEEFAREGFEAASLNQILASAQMSKGQAYHYIADKADLYAAVMNALGRLGAAMDFSFGNLLTPMISGRNWVSSSPG
ncbi:MAG: helix-turn-helix domain-containing protein [Microthrixaceae bacterium]